MYTWRLPDGTETNNRQEYLDEWKALRDALEAKYDIKVKACDPGISFTDNSDNRKLNYEWVDIPVWFAKRLI